MTLGGRRLGSLQERSSFSPCIVHQCVVRDQPSDSHICPSCNLHRPPEGILTSNMRDLHCIPWVPHEHQKPSVKHNVSVPPLWYQILCDEDDTDPTVVTPLRKKKLGFRVFQCTVHQIIQYDHPVLTILCVFIQFTSCWQTFVQHEVGEALFHLIK